MKEYMIKVILLVFCMVLCCVAPIVTGNDVPTPFGLYSLTGIIAVGVVLWVWGSRDE